MPAESLINKYRPHQFDDVLGHDYVIQTLQRHLISDTHSHCYLLTGVGGIGKTTIARLIGNYFNAETTEIDAAEQSGVDDMRALKAFAEYRSLSGNGNRMIVIDECHNLSKSAWNALHKILEEPPEHLFFALCTTEFAKVPATITQRCYHVVLRPLHPKVIDTLIDTVIQKEKWNIPDPVLNMIGDAATGQPRKALAYLQAAVDCQSITELRAVIELQDDSPALLEIARATIKGLDWRTVKQSFPRITNDEFERASGSLGRYILTVMLNADERQARDLWPLLSALTAPYNSFDRRVCFMEALGRIMWSK